MVLSKQSLVLTTLKEKLLKTSLEKEKMLVTNIFSFSNNVFYPFENESDDMRDFFVVCKCFQFGEVKGFVVW